MQFFTRKGVRPYCVAFAGAEFVVLEKTRIRQEDFWVVLVEVCAGHPPAVCWVDCEVFCVDLLFAKFSFNGSL